MLNRVLLISILLFSVFNNGFTQVRCDELGQNPGTAFPVCGVSTFSIESVAICGNKPVAGQCNIVPVTDKNPYWYKFMCFTSGTLGFEIKPTTITDDYDWQLFDITNHNPDDVYSDASLFVACNWSGETGLTGASSAGTALARCDGLGVPLFSSMPSLIEGHEYVLLISHFSDSQSGYSLSFGGGTANITDPVNPGFDNARASCDGTKFSVKLNKKMKCSSVAIDGSDFSITPPMASIISAAGVGCTNGFDMDSIVISLDRILPPGTYTIGIKTGTDNNNLLDNCNRGIPDGQTLPVTVYPFTPTPMDSLSKVGCAPDVLDLVFRDPIKCNTIAADGSDFTITGTFGVNVSSAEGICSSGRLTNVVRIHLSKPIQGAGTFLLQLQNGTDGNTVTNECGVQTAAGSSRPFDTKDTVSAMFKSEIHFGCVEDTVNYLHDGRNGVNSWQWSFDDNIVSATKGTTLTYHDPGLKQAVLVVSNGVCSDTATAVITLNNNVIAAFEATAVVCPGDPAFFINKSIGNVASWHWIYGNGNSSVDSLATSQFYPSSNITKDIPIQLIVKNAAGCADTATHTIRVVGNCYIAIPKAFSPNNDGLNDFLYPTNAYKARDLLFRVYNRNGQLLFETKDWTNKWDGTFKGNPQDPGTYVWILNYTNIESGKRFELRGSTVLIR